MDVNFDVGVDAEADAVAFPNEKPPAGDAGTPPNPNPPAVAAVGFAPVASSRSFCSASCACAYPALAFARNAAPNPPPVGLVWTAGSGSDGSATEGG